MKKIKILLVFSFVFFSGSSFADTYSAISVQSCSLNFGGSWHTDTSIANLCASELAYYIAADLTSTVQVQSGGCVITFRSSSLGLSPASCSNTYSCPGGGTVSGSNCINAPTCASPSSYVNGICTAPLVTCTAGQQKTLLILSGTYPPAGTPPTIILNHDRTATMEAPLTVSQGGCVYTIPTNPKQNTGCSTNPAGLMYCRVVATQNGSYLSGADTALDGALTASQTPVPSANPGCILSSSGAEICATSNKLNCGVVNGTQVCVKDGSLQSNGLPASIIDGQVVPSTPNANGQNVRCVMDAGGNSTCINLPQATCGAGSAFTCLTPETTTANPNPQTIPVSNNPTTVTKTQNQTNPDNTRTVTTTTTQDVANQSPYVATQQIDAAGNIVSTTYTGAQIGPGNGVSTAPGDGSTNEDLNSTAAKMPPGDLTGIDSVFSDGTSAMGTATGGITASNFLASAPVPQSAGTTCQTVPMNYKSLHYTFDPCGKLAMFREMFAYLLYILTVYSIYEIAVRPSVNA